MHTTPDGFNTTDDTELMGRIALLINEKSPSASAAVWHSGGGIFGILLQLGDGKEAFFGTADITWGADVQDAEGEYIDSIMTDVQCEEPDEAKVANALLSAVHNYLNISQR